MYLRVSTIVQKRTCLLTQTLICFDLKGFIFYFPLYVQMKDLYEGINLKALLRT